MRRRVREFPLVLALCGLLLTPAQAATPPPPPPLETLYDNAARADLDGTGAALVASDLAAAGWTPGRTLTLRGARLTWPRRPPGARDNVRAAGQTVRVRGRGDALAFLVTSTGGREAGGAGSVTYADGSRSPYRLTAPDWRTGPLGATVLALPHIATPGGLLAERARLYVVTVPLVRGREVASVRLPVAPRLHVFALAVRESSPGWTGTWAAATSGRPAVGPWTGRTLRLVVHVSTGGRWVRLRFDNTFAPAPVRIGAATVALRAAGAAGARTVAVPPGPGVHPAARPDTGTVTRTAPAPVGFGGRRGVDVPAETRTVGDPLAFAVPDGSAGGRKGAVAQGAPVPVGFTGERGLRVPAEARTVGDPPVFPVPDGSAGGRKGAVTQGAPAPVGFTGERGLHVPAGARTVGDPPVFPVPDRSAGGRAGAVAQGAPVPVGFGGERGVEVPAGAQVVSDPLAFAVPDGGDLLVSLHLPGTVASVPLHGLAVQRSYVSEPGDHTADAGGTAYTGTITTWPLLTGVDVAGGPGSVVLLGDSITDGDRSTVDAGRRWPDALAARLRAQHAVPRFGVLNAGIAGNRVLADRYPGDGVSTVVAGVSALHRLDRDVFAQTSVRTLVVFEGINDLRARATAAEVIAGLREIAERARERGVRVLGATLPPCGGSARCTPAVETERAALNAWIRDAGAFDGVLDFDRALRDPAAPARMLPAYDSGDHLHPGDAGYAALAEAVDLGAL
ncbi:GDSL-type esterase/lipase family protein [Streptomyces sp. NPDC001388]|uniref:GDSL-type esterase/lipase family protein n=1 Tax=Streptomyces sp. NPDC001388 TaxID=3364568 RepID=UPI0036892A95